MRKISIILSLALLFLIAGCGNSTLSVSDYEKKAKSAYEDIEKEITNISNEEDLSFNEFRVEMFKQLEVYFEEMSEYTVDDNEDFDKLQDSMKKNAENIKSLNEELATEDRDVSSETTAAFNESLSEYMTLIKQMRRDNIISLELEKYLDVYSLLSIER